MKTEFRSGPVPLVIGDCQVTRILTQSRVVIMVNRVPYSLADESNTAPIHRHLQKSISKAFHYMMAEGFIKDTNYTINQAVIGTH